MKDNQKDLTPFVASGAKHAYYSSLCGKAPNEEELTTFLAEAQKKYERAVTKLSRNK